MIIDDVDCCALDVAGLVLKLFLLQLSILNLVMGKL